MNIEPRRLIADRILAHFHPCLSVLPDQFDQIGLSIPIPVISEADLRTLISETQDFFRAHPVLLEPALPVYIAGDLHGNIFDLIRILAIAGIPPRNRFLFLGDYVDRGQYSVEVVALLFSLMLRYPNHVYLIRGNHEFSKTNAVYGFKAEIFKTYRTASESLWDCFNECFAWMPIAAIVGKDIFCVHGGISPLLTSFTQIKTLKRPIESYDFSVLYDLLWSDPSSDILEYQKSTRGNGTVFGPVAVREFLAHFNVRVIIRGHECVTNGIELFAGDSVYTVFSSSNYQDSSGNRCGLIYASVEGELRTFSLPPLTQIPRDVALLETGGEDAPEAKEAKGAVLVSLAARRVLSDFRVAVPGRTKASTDDGLIIRPNLRARKTVPLPRSRSVDS
jgi:protein phosphatase